MKARPGTADLIGRVVEEAISRRNEPRREEERYIHPSSLARGCMLYVARELLGLPKPQLEARVSRILEVGTEGHRRILRYLERITLAREVFFQDDEYRIRGYCDAILFVPPSLDGEQAGFYALEVKTTGSAEYERIVDEGAPKEEHVRQCQIYIWGLGRYYRGAIPVSKGLILYENRDTLKQAVFEIGYDEAAVSELLAQIRAMLGRMEQGLLPEDHLPQEHWAHRYCAYLDLCGPGKAAVEWQKKHREGVPDHVLAQVIAERMVRKQRQEAGGRAQQRSARSLETLAAQFGWE